MNLWPQIVDTRIYPWRCPSNAERYAGWESAYYDVPPEFYDLNERPPNNYPWKWRKDKSAKVYAIRPKLRRIDGGSVSLQTNTLHRVAEIKPPDVAKTGAE